MNDHFRHVRQHWSEDTVVASRLRERMEAFLEARVGAANNFNMSFTEFLNQPTYVCDLMLEVLSNRAPTQDKELADLVDQLSRNK